MALVALSESELVLRDRLLIQPTKFPQDDKVDLQENREDCDGSKVLHTDSPEELWNQGGLMQINDGIMVLRVVIDYA